MIRNLAVVSAAICGALAGCRAALDAESALPPSRIAPAVDSEAYMKEINELQAAGKLERIEVDRDEDGETDLVFWCRDGALVKTEELPHIEKAELDLPPFGAFDRLVFREWGHAQFTVEAAGEIALFYQCLKEASMKEHLGSADYFGPDGGPVYGTFRERGWRRGSPPVLLFMKGDELIWKIEMSGSKERDCTIIKATGRKTYFVNSGLPVLIERFREKTRKE